MQVVHEVCCGLDVHKKSVTACVLWAAGRRRQTREFGTFTRELLELVDWLRDSGVTHVALESTGVYGKPVWNLLEGQFEVLLVNAQHIKAVPGRKTDQRDSEWIADLLQHGLLRASFVPPTPTRELRDLTRYRASLAQKINRIANRIQKVRRGTKRATIAVAHNLLVIAYYLLRDRTCYRDLGPDYFDRLNSEGLRRRLTLIHTRALMIYS